MGSRVDAAINIVLVGCAIVVTTLVVRREMFASEPPRAEARKPVHFPSWQERLKNGGERIGPENAQLQLVVFSDFQCPYCARFHKEVKEIRARFPSNVAFTYLHFPLATHEFAESAAQAAECARVQHRFEEMSDVLFGQQRELGKTDWVDLARNAHVPDVGAFDACMKGESSRERIALDRKLGDDFGLKGTPTVLVNGWMLPVPPTAKEMTEMLNRVSAGKPPVSISS